MQNKNIETGCCTEPQLYDLNADIGQRTNVADQHPTRVRALFELLEQTHGPTSRTGAALPFSPG